MQKEIVFPKIVSVLQGYADIPTNEINQLLEHSSIKEFSAKEIFVHAGEISKNVGFIYQGLFKAYCLSLQGQLYIRNFCSEGGFLGAYASVLLSRPADMTIEAMEPSIVVVVPYKQLQLFYASSTAWQELARKIAENHYIEREKKEYNLLSCSTVERYMLFLEENPHLQHRVTQAEISSYIGVAPESLSRALSGLRNKKS